jgi:adenylate cyclase
MSSETSADRQATVLFADVTGSTRLYEAAGDAAAAEAIARCMERLRACAQGAGGRVVKRFGDQIMAVFGSPDDAAEAAARMHQAIDALPAVGETALGVHIGLHCGPVLQRDGDVYGDTVNLAARLASAAVKGQTVTSSETLSRLGPVFRAWSRRLYPVQVKGRAGEVELCELVWRASADETTAGLGGARGRPNPLALRVLYRGKTLVRRRQGDVIVIGREQTCELVVLESKASRRHCTIERRPDKFVLADHSTNGTYITQEGDPELLLRREELILRRHGWIAFGEPLAASPSAAEYFCESS